MTTNFTGQRTDKTTVVLWSLWDLGSAAFNAVLITFVFSVYLTDSVGKTIDSRFTPTTWLAIAIGIGGMFIALLAPVIGQRSDARGTRRRSVRVWTLITIIIMLSLYFIRNDDPIYFWLGITILAIGSVTYELGEVSYFAMLNQVSTEKNVGRVSGFGWALGYFGGIFLLLICYFGSAHPRYSGMASAMEEVSYEFGTLLSVAVLGSLMQLFYSWFAPAQVADSFESGLANPQLFDAAYAAFNSGFTLVMLVVAAVSATIAGITAWLLHNNPKETDYAHE